VIIFFHCGVEGAVVDRSRNDGVMGGMWSKEEKRRKSVNFSTDAANISPHRMYEMYMLGNICFFLTSF
jgi:hypothetical protein